jgi:hypothetical protein
MTLHGGRAPKAKGSRLERALVKLLQDHGLGAERIPLSGSAGGRYSGDLTVPVLGVDRTVECKAARTDSASCTRGCKPATCSSSSPIGASRSSSCRCAWPLKSRKLGALADEKARGLPFGAALNFRAGENIEDPLRCAILTAIAVAFETGSSSLKVAR